MPGRGMGSEQMVLCITSSERVCLSAPWFMCQYFKVLKGPLRIWCQNRIVSVTDEGKPPLTDKGGESRDREGSLWEAFRPLCSSHTEERKTWVEKASDCSAVLRKLLPGLWSVPKPVSQERDLYRAGMGQHYPCWVVSVWGQCSRGWRAWPQHKDLWNQRRNSWAVSQLGFPQLVVVKAVWTAHLHGCCRLNVSFLVGVVRMWRMKVGP